MVKSRRMRWEGHAAFMEDFIYININCHLEDLKGTHHFKTQV
jgi:hypothetical protein